MYTLQRFGTVFLPIYDTVTEVGTGQSVDGTVRLIDGYMYDAHGTDPAPLMLPYDVTLQATSLESSLTTLQTTVNALKAMRGKVDELYRELPDGNLNWCKARLMEIPSDRTSANVFEQPQKFVFRVLSPWYGDHHGDGLLFGDPGVEFGDGHVFGESDAFSLDQRAVNYSGASGTFTIGETITGSGSGATGTLVYDTGTALVLESVTGNYLATDTLTGSASGVTADADSAGYTATYIQLVNAGNATVDNCVITVAVPGGSPAITALTIVVPDEASITYSGTIIAGTELVIDVGAWSVENDGDDDYDGLVRNAGHAIFPWHEIAAGGGWVGVARTGGDDTCTITFTYSDRWE